MSNLPLLAAKFTNLCLLLLLSVWILWTNEFPFFFVGSFSVAGVHKVFMSMPYKRDGLVTAPNFTEAILETVKLLIEDSVTLGNFPNILKSARAALVFKSGERDGRNN